MARSKNGIGSTYYGTKDRYPDGSFITTEWFILLYLPIIPIRSMRVIFGGRRGGLFSTSMSYIVVEEIKLDWQQVLSTYFVVIATAFLAYLCGMFASSLVSQEAFGFAWGMGFIVPIIISYSLFLQAK
jgi:hypothetical protein